MPKLAKPKNKRYDPPQVCGRCRYYEAHRHGWLCQRQGTNYQLHDYGPDHNSQYLWTCDSFENIDHESEGA